MRYRLHPLQVLQAIDGDGPHPQSDAMCIHPWAKRNYRAKWTEDPGSSA